MLPWWLNWSRSFILLNQLLIEEFQLKPIIKGFNTDLIWIQRKWTFFVEVPKDMLQFRDNWTTNEVICQIRDKNKLSVFFFKLPIRYHQISVNFYDFLLFLFVSQRKRYIQRLNKCLYTCVYSFVIFIWTFLHFTSPLLSYQYSN